MSNLQQRLSDVGALPAAPGVTLEILRFNEREDADVSELAEIVSRDPAIGSKLLKAANSSALGRQGKVSNFHDAVMVLGTRQVNMLALSFSLTSGSSRDANDAFNYTGFWTASAVTTVAARGLAGMYAKEVVGEAFVAGLLCDLGQLVLAECATDLYDPVLREFAKGERTIQDIEQELLGANHAQLAESLFMEWGLPPLICQAVGGHHDPEAMDSSDPKAVTLARILHVSSCCAELYSDGVTGDVDQILALASRYFDTTQEACESLFESLRNEVDEFIEIVDPANMDPTESAQLRARAGERLMEQNLDLERRFQSVSRALASMSRRNAELESRANFDPLTGIQTRAHFEELADKHIKTAAASDQQTGLLMMDVDHFKQINDSHGHLCGDTVLMGVGDALSDALPSDCVVARFGGDEFIALCPGVGPDELLEIAERLLSQISQRPCIWETETIQPTLSIGGVVAGGDAVTELAPMIRQADVQLYRAKNAGRNRASVAEFSADEA